jgi:hypothetical protein
MILCIYLSQLEGKGLLESINVEYSTSVINISLSKVRKDFIVSLTNNHRLVHLHSVGPELDSRSNVGQIKKRYSI